MTRLYFKCPKEQFRAIDLFLAEQQYSEKPDFDEIVLEVDNKPYYYSVQHEFDSWFIVTDLTL